MKKVIFFDVDETIVKGQSQKMFLDFLLKKKKISYAFYISVLLWFFFYKLRLVNNPMSVMTYAFSFLKNERCSDIDMLADQFFNEYLKRQFYSEAVKIIHEYQVDGDEVVLLSNASDIIVSRIAKYFNIRDFACTVLSIDGGYYTGNIETVMFGTHKAEFVSRFMKDRQVKRNFALAYGDHDTDIPVFLEVGKPIAVNPRGKLLRKSIANDWQIVRFSSLVK